MTIKTISPKRGIHAIYDRGNYYIYSEWYGFVARSTRIYRVEENKAVIDMLICDWYGYWSLKDIIKRGLRKLERQFAKDYAVEFTFTIARKGFSNLGESYCLQGWAFDGTPLNLNEEDF